MGGGFIMVPLQVLVAKTSQLRANATSLAAIVPISFVGALVYYFGARHPQVNLKMAALLTAGSVGGAYLGARLVSRLPERTLRMLVAGLLVVIALKELVHP